MKLLGKGLVTLTMGIWAVLFFFPQVSYAVDYSITDVNIEATIQENGQVEVIETHIYEFDGEFNGITREVVPKKGAKILELQATENGKALKVEKEENLYRIHRKGADESITITISYFIENGIDVYADVADFHWPFFDDRNESTYENMTIIVHPPKETTDVIAYGYDEAFQTEEVAADGSVLFQLGEVPAGEKGDIRVAYDASLFPGVALTADKMMKGEILKAEQELVEEAEARAETRETLSTVAVIVIPIFAILFFITVVGLIMRARAKKRGVVQGLPKYFFVPKEILSMPATILFTKGTAFQPGEAMSAALLDLVRKGYVQKGENNSFILVSDSRKRLKHEDVLLEFLFEEIGNGKTFSFDDLKAYTDKKKNHEKFQSHMMKWNTAIFEEVKGGNLYEKNGKLRLFFLFAGLLLTPFFYLFPAYDLFGWFAAAILLSLSFFALAAFYVTKSWDGVAIVQEWRALQERLLGISIEDWKQLSENDHMRAYIYGIGTKDKRMMEKNNEFVQLFRPPLNSSHSEWGGVDLQTMILIGPMASAYFHSAYGDTLSSTSSSSSPSSSSGGGVGGGGGGSGAF